MDNKIKKEKSESVGVIHIILFHSYIVFLISVILGVILDQFLGFDFFYNVFYQYLGVFMIILGTFGIFWSQNTNKSSKKELNTERDTSFFIRGPYKYLRNPTNLSITIMSLGLGFVLNSIFSIILVLIAYFISRFLFIKKQDLILEKRYGQVFLDYKKKVKNWI